MFDVPVTSTTMKLLPLACLCLLTRSGTTFAGGNGPEVIDVEEGRDAMLPCSLSPKEDIQFKVFDWKKDGQNQVFMYEAGILKNDGRTGQDEQFKGRVSYFHDELKNGNASIIIRNTKMADSGIYTCTFSLLQPSQMFHLQLAVAPDPERIILKNRLEENHPGAAPKPYITILNQTKDWSLLQCVVRGASPKPTVEWQDSAGNILPAKELQVSERGGSYDIILQTTVTKTDRYRCVATQEEIYHQIHAETYVLMNEFPTGLVVAVAVLVGVLLLLAVLVVKGCIKINCKKGSGSPPESDPLKDPNPST
ncbi:butyrophilin subfamily 2 member A2-like isoform X1 [Enoplosus armatus]|uniref:butyrophilin subfamily 2 member A2-like isoform X1 n=1 Tax=Enoplosus armatus TaxID=215367 RepID=UPI0039912E69